MEQNEEAQLPTAHLILVVEALLKDPPEIPDERLLKFFAQYYWAEGRINESLTCLRLIERREELSVSELRLRGYWQLYEGDADGAHKTFSEALQQDGGDAAVRFGYAYALFYLEDYSAAAEVFQRLADEGGPLRCHAIMAAASKAMAAGERPDEIQMAPIPGLSPGLSEVLQIRLLHGPAPAIKEILARLAALAPEERLPLQRLLAELYLEVNQERQAVSLIDELLEGHAEDGVLMFFKGIALRRAGQLEQSSATFFRALMLAPLDARTWGGFAACCLELNESDKAVEIYRAALFLDERNPSYWSELGMAESQLQHYEQARRCFTESLELGLHNFSNYFNRGTCSLYLHDGESALADWQLAIATEPSHPRAAEAAALIRELGGETPDDRFIFGEDDK